MIIDIYARDALTANAFHDMQAAGVKAVIHKASQGASFQDDGMPFRRARATSVGMLWGTYHFGTAEGQAADQAKFYLDTAKPMVGELVCLDWERVNPSGKPHPFDMTLAHAEHFCEEVFRQLGRWPVLYANRSFLEEMKVPKTSSLINCRLWVARYNTDLGGAPAPFSDWKLWQYTDQGRVDGVEGFCDVSKFNGCDECLKSQWPF